MSGGKAICNRALAKKRKVSHCLTNKTCISRIFMQLAEALLALRDGRGVETIIRGWQAGD